VTFTATVTSGSPGTPTGTVTFKEGTTTIGTDAVAADGTAKLHKSDLPVGTHSITASYGGDGSFNGSDSTAVSQVVNKADSSTALTSTPNPAQLGQDVTFTATVTGPGTPTGTVTFKEGTTELGTGAVGSDGTATLHKSDLAPGSHDVKAVYGGDANLNGSESSAVSQVVNKKSTATALASTPNPSHFGDDVTLTATVTGSGTPTGTVTFKEGTTVLGSDAVGGDGKATLQKSDLTVGSHDVIASYGGDGSFAGSDSATATQVVDKASSSTSLTSGPSPAKFGQDVTLTATVSGTGTPTGTVTFKEGSTVLGTDGVRSDGTATLHKSDLPVGTHSLSASYGGDGNLSASDSAAASQEITKRSAAMLFSCTPSSVTVGAPTTCTAAVGDSDSGTATRPSGSVTFASDDFGTFTPATSCSLPASGADTCSVAYRPSSVGNGSHALTATFAGDAAHTGAAAHASEDVVPPGAGPQIPLAKLVLSPTHVKARGGRARFKARCAGRKAQLCAGNLRLRPAHGRTGKPVKFRLHGGRRKTLALRVPKTSLASLARTGRATARIIVRLSHGRGPRQVRVHLSL
jgi:hypothetical protein